MQRDMANILACPLCSGDLELDVAVEDDAEIVSGSLRCLACKTAYPIVDTIPDFTGNTDKLNCLEASMETKAA